LGYSAPQEMISFGLAYIINDDLNEPYQKSLYERLHQEKPVFQIACIVKHSAASRYTTILQKT
ncbi:MAG: hypothetical protein PVG32_01935, partial [Anaerolineales bacterium]